MGTISSAFGIMSGALDADQSALNVVANNVANASTPGYTEEVPDWKENPSIDVNGHSIGTGASETGATSLRDGVLTARLDQQQQLASASGSRLTALNDVQALFTPDSGSASSKAGDIGSDITSFFSSFASLEAAPTDSSLREAVLSSATTLAGDVSNAAATLNTQKSNIDQEAAGVTSQVNALTTAISQLNQQIQSSSADGSSGTLLDDRSEDISQLSQLIGINQITTENSGLAITTTAVQTLVSGNTSFQLTNGSVGGVTHFFVGTTDITSQLAGGGGELGGYLTARDQDIPGVLNSLDQLAYNVTAQVNMLNSTGTPLSGVSGNIFSVPAQVAGSAALMSVVMTNPDSVAAAGAGDDTGDNSNAKAIAALGTSPIIVGQTPINFYSNLVSTLGAIVSGVQAENTAQNASVTQLQTQSNALSSVNLNDEASSMTTLERSYQAASQVFAMLNTIMASALNLGEQTSVS